MSKMTSFSLFCCSIYAFASAAAAADRKQAETLFEQANYAEAYQHYQALAVQADTPPRLAAQDLRQAADCLKRLNRVAEWDDLREQAAAAHPGDWAVATAIAEANRSMPSWGFVTAGQFSRGDQRGGNWQNHRSCYQRDRTRLLQLMTDALPAFLRDRDAMTEEEEKSYLHTFRRLLLPDKNDSWRLQILTDLTTLPDFDDGSEPRGDGAPVNDDGSPVFYALPESYATAHNDGERWRWLLHLTEQSKAPHSRLRARLEFADFLRSQFGVQTLLRDFFYADSGDDSLAAILAVETLSDDETIARLAGGIRRFQLPEEFNYIKIYQRLYAESPQQFLGQAKELATIYENRRQYPKAVEWWRKEAEKYEGDASAKDNCYASRQIRRITGNWGEFLPGKPQVAGQPATATLRFRNATKANLTVHRIDLEAMLAASKKHIRNKGGGRHLDWRMTQPSYMLDRLLKEKEGDAYVKEQLAAWEETLEPLPGHRDRQVIITTPIVKPGAYLLTATLPNGNLSRLPLIVEDVKIVSKPLEDGNLWQVLDAASGAPVPGLELRLFGWNVRWNSKTKRNQITIRELTAKTDADGLAVLDTKTLKTNDSKRSLQWLVETTSPGGAYTCHGYDDSDDFDHSNTWENIKAFGITDRPVYRPGQKVDFKFWIAKVAYERDTPNPLAGTALTVRLLDPKGDEVLKTSLTADGYGGVAGDWQIPGNAALGMYSLLLEDSANRSFRHRIGFRVEEYKKPEFEVSVDLPTEPPLLGDQVQVTVRAKYYFGAPVTSGQASIKVLRYDYSDSWWPVRPWDWFYGNGYAWLAEDAVWHPGWTAWSHGRPYFDWLPPRHSRPPEVVAQIDRPLSEDGAVTFTIDTNLAKTLFGDRDHRYEITAEVRDQSRRTIVGAGSVIVPRQPFAVYAWTDCGYYHAGDPIKAYLQARTLSGAPVQGAGTLKLFRLGRDPLGELVEKLEQEWPLAPDENGAANMTINAAEPGQYRLTWTVTDAKGRAVEGATVITIRKTGKQVELGFHYNALELIPDRPEYAPGDTVRLAVNTAQPNSTVMVFLRPVNGACQPPVVLRLQGQSTILDLAVTRADMPNFFVEAYTIVNGEMHHVIREIFVPPEKKILQVEVLPDQVRHRPGSQAEVNVKLTDAAGQPFAGNLTVAVYDASLDYIAGGDNTGDIRAAFWKWRRRHYLNGSVMDWRLDNCLRKNEENMPGIGIFGELGEYGTDMGFGAAGAPAGVLRRAKAGGGVRSGAVSKLMVADAEPMSLPAPASNIAMESAFGTDEGAATAAPVAIRSQFADTALWIASLDTQPDGTAKVTVPMPENLTTWKMRVWGVDDHTRVGMGATELITSKDLILRLQAPRFLVEKDEVVLSANVHNYLPAAQTVEVKLELDGPCLEMVSPPAQTVVIAAGAEARVDWRAKTVQEGEAVVRMFALAQAESDAMEQRFPVKVHGIDKTVAATGFLRPNQTIAQVKLVIPAERRPETTRLTVRWSPSLAMAMLDAIPYLLDYPYDCTEQTLNRFLPAVLTRDTLRRLGLNLSDLQKQRANLNAQELGDPDTRRQQWKRSDRDPVFDEDEMDKIITTGVRDLCAMQCSDGGWGWFSGWGERSWPHTTAQVVHGFLLAKATGVDIPTDALQRGIAWLQNYQAEELRCLQLPKDHRDHKTRADNTDAFVFRVLAETSKPGKSQSAMADLLFRDKSHLSQYGLALFGLGMSADPAERRTAEILRNLKQFLVLDDENQTAWLNLGNSSFWWFWYGDEIETHAAFLRLLVTLEPDNDLAPRLVKYLLNNRKHATYWRSTRDTAACLEAFADFIAKTGEQTPDLTVDISLDGKPLTTSRITRDNLFTANLTLDLTGDDLATGEHTLLIRKTGDGPLYFNTYLSYFTTEDMIKKTGLELKIDRQVYQLFRDDSTAQTPSALGQVVSKRVEKYSRVPVASDAPVQSGALLEIELTVESKNDYEYILLEDFKPAGCEPVDLRSGYNGNAFGAYVEFRDDRTAFLLQALPRGRRSATYRVRAEIPGRFSALPTIITGMYAPELRANADEIKIVILDEKQVPK